MPWKNGTATDHLDLITQVKDFLSSGVEMGSQAHTVERYDTDYDGNGNYELIMKGPGSTSGDAVYTGIVTDFDVTEDWYNWYINGFTGFNSGLTFFNQPGSITTVNERYLPQLPLFNTSMEYWLRASGRAFTLVAKVSTVYQTMYNGWLSQYALPNTYPAPHAVCGSLFSTSSTANQRWSSTEDYHRGFPDPYIYENSAYTACGWYLSGNNWKTFGNRDEISTSRIYTKDNTWPYVQGGLRYNGGYENYMWTRLSQNLDGSSPLFPIHLISYTPNNNVHGFFEGCFALPGFEVNAEDILNIGGLDYIVFPINFHTENDNYWCMRLD